MATITEEEGQGIKVKEGKEERARPCSSLAMAWRWAVDRRSAATRGGWWRLSAGARTEKGERGGERDWWVSWLAWPSWANWAR
jgi:hypothetical protein